MINLRLKARKRIFRRWQKKPYVVAPLSNESHECMTCHTNYTGNFCPRCGQSARVGRYSFKSTMMNFMDVWGLGNRGMFRTIRDLILRPGYMIRDYLSGMRMAYFPPFKMFFVLAAFALLVANGFNVRLAKISQNDDKKVEINGIQKNVKADSQDGTADLTTESETTIVEKMDDPRERKMSETTVKVMELMVDFGKEHPNISSLLLLLMMSFPLYLFFRHCPNIPDLRFSEFFITMVYVSNMYSIYSVVCAFFTGSDTLGTCLFPVIFLPLKQLSGYSFKRVILYFIVVMILLFASFVVLAGLYALLLYGYVTFFIN